MVVFVNLGIRVWIPICFAKKCTQNNANIARKKTEFKIKMQNFLRKFLKKDKILRIQKYFREIFAFFRNDFSEKKNQLGNIWIRYVVSEVSSFVINPYKAYWHCTTYCARYDVYKENRIYIRVEFRKSLSMNFVSPFQPELKGSSKCTNHVNVHKLYAVEYINTVCSLDYPFQFRIF